MSTEIVYSTVAEQQGNNSRVATVKLPFAMQADTQQPQRSYVINQNAPDGILQYPVGGTATVTRAGAPGNYRVVEFDHRGRGTRGTNAAGQISRAFWDVNDQQIATLSPDGLMTATQYNGRQLPTDAWGPAPVAQFQEVNAFGSTYWFPKDDVVSNPAAGPCRNLQWNTDCDVPLKFGFFQSATGNKINSNSRYCYWNPSSRAFDWVREDDQSASASR